ncbi:hypothetical protein ACWGJP_06515 [Microbacterium sp. NPDC055903]
MTAPTSDARAARAAALKERIYLTFTALAVLIATGSHGHPTAGEVALTLFITAAGMLLAILVADIISHLVAHEAFMNRAELGHAVSVSVGAFGALIIPFLFLGLAGLGVWTVETAIRAGVIALVATLVLIGWIAIRRVPLTWWQRLVALAGEAVLGLAVIGLELLAHG